MPTLDLQQTLFDIYLAEILVPALVELPEVDFKRTSLKVREEAARYLRHRRGASIKTVARHLGVTHRWVSKVTNQPPPEEPEEGWFMAILDILTGEFPDGLTAEEVRRRLLRQRRRLSFQATVAHLDLYCDLGKLERHGDGYRALAPVEIATDASGTPSTEKLRRKLQMLRPVCESYARGDGGSLFGVLLGTVDAESLDEMAAEMQSAVAAILAKYNARSLDREASGTQRLVNVTGLLALGQSPGSPAGGGTPCSDTTPTSAATSSSSGSSESSGSLEPDPRPLGPESP